MTGEFFPKHQIVLTPAVSRISDQVVADVLHVTTQLVAPPGTGCRLVSAKHASFETVSQIGQTKKNRLCRVGNFEALP